MRRGWPITSLVPYLVLATVSMGTNAAAGTRPAAEQHRPNILWLIADDLSTDLGSYGAPLVQTPNLDRLARQGARYTNALATAPVCSSARSALVTGMYQTSIGAHQHRTREADRPALQPPVSPISELLREAGYFVSNASHDFAKPGKTDYNFQHADLYDGVDWRERGEGQPFFAQVQFFKPHRPFHRDGSLDPAKVTLPSYYPDHPLTRRDWADYLETVQQLDQEVGRILARLEADGLADSTLVLFFADQGRAHLRGKQWLYEGGIHIPLIVRWPGRIAPGTVVADLVSSIDLAPTSLGAAGLLVPGHMEGRDFLSRSAARREYVFAARDRCDETVDRIRSVRSRRYKYIRNFYPERPYTQHNNYKQGMYPVWALLEVLEQDGKLTRAQEPFMTRTRPPEELYDLDQDSLELNDLARSADHQETLERFRAQLDGWMEATGDRGAVSEPPGVVEYWRAHSSWGSVQSKGLSADISWKDLLEYWEKTLLD